MVKIIETIKELRSSKIVEDKDQAIVLQVAINRLDAAMGSSANVVESLEYDGSNLDQLKLTYDSRILHISFISKEKFEARLGDTKIEIPVQEIDINHKTIDNIISKLIESDH